MNPIKKLLRQHHLRELEKETLKHSKQIIDILSVKATPEKPHKVTNVNGEFVKWVCPLCGGFLIKNYPCKCGKMIRWRDDVE